MIKQRDELKQLQWGRVGEDAEGARRQLAGIVGLSRGWRTVELGAGLSPESCSRDAVFRTSFMVGCGHADGEMHASPGLLHVDACVLAILARFRAPPRARSLHDATDRCASSTATRAPPRPSVASARIRRSRSRARRPFPATTAVPRERSRASLPGNSAGDPHLITRSEDLC